MRLAATIAALLLAGCGPSAMDDCRADNAALSRVSAATTKALDDSMQRAFEEGERAHQLLREVLDCRVRLATCMAGSVRP